MEKDIVNIDFTCKYVSGALTTSEESTEVVWATVEEAMELVTLPLTKKRLARMLSGSSDAALFCFTWSESSFDVVEDAVFPIGRQ